MNQETEKPDVNIVAAYQQLKESMRSRTESMFESMRSGMMSKQSFHSKVFEGDATGAKAQQMDAVFKTKDGQQGSNIYAAKQLEVNEKKEDYQQKNQKTEEQFRYMDDHRISLEELTQRLETSLENGLTDQLANERNLKLGDNKLPDKPKKPWWIKLIKEMTNWFSIMLWVGAALCFMAYGLSDDPSQIYLGAILVFVIVLTGIITYYQSAKSDALMEGFKNMLPQSSTVIRGGVEKRVASEKLVPGDIIKMSMGEKIPADIRIIFSREMRVDNSALTGEVDPLLRSVECTHPDNPLETKNLAFFGTLCKEGQGRGVVIRIGENTVLGQIANLASSHVPPKSPLRIELDRFVLMITIIAIVLGVVFVILGAAVMKIGPVDSIVFGIGILVANVPEGLLGCITISLAITAKRLSEKQVLVKNLEAVETLGSTSCICSDKTGTLTQNKMTVEHVWYNQMKAQALNRQKHGPNANYEYEIDDPSFKILHECAMISSEAKFDIPPNQMNGNVNWLTAPVIGDATETALVRFFQPIEDIAVTRSKYQYVKLKDGSVAKMPFNSTVKFALSIVEQEKNDSSYCIYMKGAPEKIWKYCSNVLDEGGRLTPIDASINKKFDEVNLSFGKNGERVLGFAKLHLLKEFYPKGKTDFNISSPENFNFILQDFTFVGLISMMDPPKDTVPYAVLKCKSAGIKVIMVTGDQPPTAAAIARQVNIIPQNVKTVDEIADDEKIPWAEAFDKAEAIVVHGDKVNQAAEEDMANGLDEDTQLMKWVTKPYCVFARTTPAQKLKIVRSCQKIGYIVGVTGDGVNDSPAIKQGDIGISMGISGSDVSKDAADMVLLNDDFASIVDGVEEGRKIFDNLKKTIVYLLTSNCTEIFPFLAYVMLQMPLPLSSIFMLVICVGTDILPALSLAYEEAELDIMTRRPRKRTEHLVSLKLITHAYLQMGWIASAAGFLAYFTTMYYYGFTISGLIGITNATAYPRPSQYFPFDPLASNLGNDMLVPGVNKCYKDSSKTTQVNCDTNSVDWISMNDAKYDLRYVLVEFDTTTNRWKTQGGLFENEALGIADKSPVTNQWVSYSVEALFYAQSAYFLAVVLVQWSNIVVCKSKKMSFMFSAFNSVMIYGIILETAISCLLLYTPGVQKIFGGRPLKLVIWTSGVIFSMMLMLWDEVRKYLIRNMPTPRNRKSNWFERNSHW